MTSFRDWREALGVFVGLDPATLEQLLLTLGALLVFLLGRLVARAVIVRRFAGDVKRLYYARKALDYTTFGLLFLAFGGIWITGFHNVGTFLGLFSAGLAIALQDLLVNLAGWLFILTRRPYEVGDRIQLGDHRGDVIDIRLFQTYMLECGNWVHADQSTGRIIMVPNSAIFRQPTASYTRSFEHIWDEIEVLVTFESDWKRAKAILQEIAETHAEHLSEGAREQIRRAAEKHMIFFNKLTPIVYTTVGPSGILLTVRFLTRARGRRGAAQNIWEAILDAFDAEPRIELAYPTTRYFAGDRESKPELRPEAVYAPDDPPRSE